MAYRICDTLKKKNIIRIHIMWINGNLIPINVENKLKQKQQKHRNIEETLDIDCKCARAKYVMCMYYILQF